MGYAPLTAAMLAPATVDPGPLTARMLGDFGGETDPLAVFDDAFPGSSLDAQWTVFEPTVADIDVSGGECHCSHVDGGVGDALWYDGFDGYLVYIELEGDFDVSIDARTSNADDTGAMPVTNYRVAALQAHDPDRASVRNYVSVGVGAIAEATLRAEWKSTVDNASDTGVLATGDFDSIEWPSGEGRLRIVRVGNVFTLSIDSTELLEVTRADLPATLQVGFVLYTNQAVAGCAAHFADFTVRTP